MPKKIHKFYSHFSLYQQNNTMFIPLSSRIKYHLVNRIRFVVKKEEDQIRIADPRRKEVDEDRNLLRMVVGPSKMIFDCNLDKRNKLIS